MEYVGNYRSDDGSFRIALENGTLHVMFPDDDIQLLLDAGVDNFMATHNLTYTFLRGPDKKVQGCREIQPNGDYTTYQRVQFQPNDSDAGDMTTEYDLDELESSDDDVKEPVRTSLQAPLQALTANLEVLLECAKQIDFASEEEDIVNFKLPELAEETLKNIAESETDVLSAGRIFLAASSTDTNLILLLHMLIIRPSITVNCAIDLIEAMRQACRYEALKSACVNLSPLLCASAQCADNAESRLACIQVLTVLLLGYQHDPVLFLSLLPSLAHTLQLTEAEASKDNGSVDGQAYQTCVALVNLVQILMSHFSGYGAVYQTLKPLLESYPRLPKVTMENELLKYKWIVQDDPMSKWPEGVYKCKEAEGIVHFRMGANFKGRRIRGYYNNTDATKQQLPYQLGQHVLCYWDSKNSSGVYMGRLDQRRQTEFRFKCRNGTMWVKSSQIMKEIEMPSNPDDCVGLRMLARLTDNRYYTYATIIGPDGPGDWRLRFDDGTDDKVDRARCINFETWNYAHDGFRDRGRVEFIAQPDDRAIHGSAHGIVLKGEYRQIHCDYPNVSELLLSEDGESFNGRHVVNDNACKNWIGIKYRESDSFHLVCEAMDVEEKNQIPQLVIPKTLLRSNQVIKSSVVTLDGKSQYINLGGRKDLGVVSGSQPFTLEAWCYLMSDPADGKKNMVIFSKFSQGCVVSVTPNRKISFLFYESQHTVNVNEWFHVAISFNGWVGTLYINGQESAGGEMPPFDDNYQEMLIGASQHPRSKRVSDYFHGVICEVRVWSTSRSAEQIGSNMNTRLILGKNNQYELRGYWPMVSTFFLLEDLSGLDNHAHLASYGVHDKAIECLPSGPQVWRALEPSALPVTGHFHSRYHNGFLLAGGARVQKDGSLYLGGIGSAVWHRNRINVSGGLFTKAVISTPTSAGSTFLQFQLQNRTLWSVDPIGHSSVGLVPCASPASALISFQIDSVATSDDGKLDHVVKVQVSTCDYNNQQILVIQASGTMPELPSGLTELGFECFTSRQKFAATTSALPLLKLTVNSSALAITQLDLGSVFYESPKLSAASPRSPGGRHYNQRSVYLGLSTALRTGNSIRLNQDGHVKLFSWQVSTRTSRRRRTVSVNRNINSEFMDVNQINLQVAQLGEVQCLRALATQLLEFEDWMKGSVHASFWKQDRDAWREKLQSIAAFGGVSSDLAEIRDAFSSLADSLDIDNKDWAKDAQRAWMKSIDNAQTVCQLADTLITLHNNMPAGRFVDPWQGRVKRVNDQKCYTINSFNYLSKESKRRTRMELVHSSGLLSIAGSTAKCAQVLAQNNDNVAEATSWLVENVSQLSVEKQKQAYAALTAETWPSGPIPMLALPGYHRAHRRARAQGMDQSPEQLTEMEESEVRRDISQILGLWETSKGELGLYDDGEVVGKTMYADYTSANGKLYGYMTNRLDGCWKFDGVWGQDDHKYAAPMHLTWTEDCQKFSGNWSLSNARGQWRGNRRTDLHMRKEMGYSGLVNLGNTCYQNSFLQCLFITKEFRRRLLQAHLKPHPKDPDAQMRRQINKAILAAKEDKKRPSKPPKGWEQRRIVEAMQEVFARLHMTQRPTVDQISMKRLHRKPFNGKKQQDSLEFVQHIFSTLEDGLKHTPLENLNNEIFGAHTKDVLRCLECGSMRSRQADFTELILSFPSIYGPIYNIEVISGKVSTLAAPPKFDRISVNLNKGRKGADFSYLCVCRTPKTGLDPITDIEILCGEDEKEIIPSPGFELLPQNLNEGGDGLGTFVFLALKRTTNGSPITQIKVLASKHPSDAPDGYELVNGDLNIDSGGNIINLAIQRGGAVRDIVIVTADSYNEARQLTPPGYKLNYVNLNLFSNIEKKSDSDGAAAQQGYQRVFLAETSGGSNQPLTRMECVVATAPCDSTPDSVQNYTAGDTEYQLRLWRGDGAPITSLEVCRAPNAPTKFGSRESVDLLPNFSTRQPPVLWDHEWRFNDGVTMHFNPHLEHDPDYQIDEILVVEGKCGGKNDHDLWGFLYHELVHATQNTPAYRRWRYTGQWIAKNQNHHNPCDFYFNDDFTEFDGKWENHRGQASWTGVKIDGSEIRQDPGGPITDIYVVKGRKKPQPPYIKLIRTPNQHNASLNAESTGTPLYLCIRRDMGPGDSKSSDGDQVPLPIVDIKVMLDPIDCLPEDYEYLIVKNPNNPDEDGVTLNTNLGDEQSRCMRIAVKRAKSWDVETDVKGNVTNNWLWDVGLYWQNKEKCPAGFRPILFTDSQCEADMNAGSMKPNPVYIFYKCGPAMDQAGLLADFETKRTHPIEATWKTSSGDWRPRVVKRCTGKIVEATWKNGAGFLRAILAQVDDVKNKNKYQLFGRYGIKDGPERAGLINFKVDAELTDMNGTFVWEDDYGTWSAKKDCFAILSYKRDSRTRYQNKELLYTAAATGNHLDDMINDYFCPEILGDKSRCAQCQDKTVTEKVLCLASAPEHLFLCVKRFDLDYRTGNVSKIMDTVKFDPVVTIPLAKDQFLRSEVFDEKNHDLQDKKEVHYGIYGLVVHSGTCVDGGHYFSYGRESDSDLSVENDKIAPWSKFDDHRVSRVPWEEIISKTSSSLADTAYLFFLRRIDNDDSASKLSPESKTTVSSSPSPSPNASAFPQLDLSLSPSLPVLLNQDSARYLEDMSNHGSVHRLVEWCSETRYQALFSSPFNVGGADERSAGNVGVDVGDGDEKKQSLSALTTCFPAPSCKNIIKMIATQKGPNKSKCIVCLGTDCGCTNELTGEDCKFAKYKAVECPYCKGLFSQEYLTTTHIVIADALDQLGNLDDGDHSSDQTSASTDIATKYTCQSKQALLDFAPPSKDGRRSRSNSRSRSRSRSPAAGSR